MAFFNRRNALLGWVVWKLGKRTAKKKAKEVVPDGRSKGSAALAAGVAAFFGVFAFWRRRKSSGES
jgi:hypothetical protein